MSAAKMSPAPVKFIVRTGVRAGYKDPHDQPWPLSNKN